MIFTIPKLTESQKNRANRASRKLYDGSQRPRCSMHNKLINRCKLCKFNTQRFTQKEIAAQKAHAALETRASYEAVAALARETKGLSFAQLLSTED